MDKGKAKQRLKGIAIIAVIVIVFGLLALGAYFITIELFGHPM